MTQPASKRLLTEASAAAQASNAATPLGAALSATILDQIETEAAPGGVLPDIFARKDGRVICKGFTRADVIAALDEAEALGRHTVVYFPRGVYDLGNGLSLSGYSAQIQGAGAGGQPTLPTGTVFYASTQTGPVLDFTGWVIPTNVFTGRVKHCDFMVRGSGVADATKNNAGIRLKIMSSATFADIAIRDTGGPCLESTSNPGNAVYLCDFERIILNTPVGAKVNDVPWFIMDEPNGNRFRGIGLRSMSTSADVGVSGAVVIKSNATYPSYATLYDAWWFENLHVPDGGTVFAAQCHTSDFINFSWHDMQKEVGATGTSLMRFTAPPAGDFGGNTISGLIPGSDGTATQPDTGIDMRQSRNRIVGVKGYKGKNVTLAAGVADTHIYLSGAMSSATDPAVVNNSGNVTNTVIDRHMNLEALANRLSRDTYIADTAVTRFFDAATNNNGGIALGKAGARIQSIGGSGSLWYTPAPSQAHVFTDGTLAEVFRVLSNGTGAKMAAGKTLQLGTSTTVARPSASVAGEGAVAWDTTLKKLIKSDGTKWDVGDGFTINVMDHGAKCDGVTDDTAALQAAINSVASTAGVPSVSIVIPGTLRLTATITISKRGVRLLGHGIGNPSNFASSPGRGTAIRWDGAAGIPMFTVTDSRYIAVEDMLIQGNTTNRPSDGFYFDSAGGSVGTNSQIKFSNVVIGSMPWTTPLTPTGTPSMDNGIRFGGLNANNDQFSLQDVVISNCTTGLALPNSQSIWGESQNVFLDSCGVGVKTSAQHAMYNMSFNACGTDVQLDSTAKVDVWGWGSEGSAQIFNITGAGTLSVDGGLWTIQSQMQGAASFATAPLLAGNLSLRNVQMNYQITPKPPLYVRGTYSPAPYVVSIKACSGLSLTEMDVRGYGAAGVTFVDISSQGVAVDTTITAKALSTYIVPQAKTGNYTLVDGETAPLIANGAAVTITLPDPTLITAGRTRFAVKNINAAAATVVSAGTSKTIDGAPSQSLTQWAGANYVSDGTQWFSV